MLNNIQYDDDLHKNINLMKMTQDSWWTLDENFDLKINII